MDDDMYHLQRDDAAAAVALARLAAYWAALVDMQVERDRAEAMIVTESRLLAAARDALLDRLLRCDLCKSLMIAGDGWLTYADAKTTRDACPGELDDAAPLLTCSKCVHERRRPAWWIQRLVDVAESRLLAPPRPSVH